MSDEFRGILIVGQERLRSHICEELARSGNRITERGASLAIDVFEESELPVRASSLAGYDVILTGWGTPMLPEELAGGIGSRGRGARYICHLTGEMRRIVPRAFIDSSEWLISNWGNAISGFVAEGTLSLLLATARRLPESRELFSREGVWKEHLRDCSTLFGKRIGLYGYGFIGREFLRLLEPFHMQVSVYDPFAPAIEGVHRCGSLEELFRDNGIISIHCGLTSETRGSVNRSCLELLPEDGIVINTARAGVIDGADLRWAAQNTRLRFGLDVFDPEPPEYGDPVVNSPLVVPTPHSAGEVGRDQYAAIWSVALDNLKRYLRGEELKFGVDASVYERMT